MYPARGCVRACALLLVCAAAAEPPALGKRTESEMMSPMPFVLGSRYGRSQPRHIAPRSDWFILGSRYGKRSEPRIGIPPLKLPPRPALLCEPTGVYQLYRCSAHAPDVRRLEENIKSSATSLSDDE